MSRESRKPEHGKLDWDGKIPRLTYEKNFKHSQLNIAYLLGFLCSGLFSDADKYKVDFLSEKLTLDDKLIVLSTAMFIDYLFFEGMMSQMYWTIMQFFKCA